MRNNFLTAVVLLAAQCHSGQAFAGPAQNEPDAPRPRIGLVLGGGGARGAAHIGVIRELERLRIPIDAIAGTSMGAVVGSLYASGKSPDELEALVRTIDWADAFVDSPRREDLSYRRKQDDAAFPVPLELGLRGSDVVLPKGLIQGQKLQLILTEQLLGVAGIRDFDNLPIPFRAVASDIATGEAYVMARGDLALAARASMSAPGIFSPVSVDGHSLVDGGLVGNVPVDVVRDMDVDVVIAVDVEFPLYPPDQLESALSISEQMLTILIRKETRRQLSTLGPGDILIRPSLGEYGSTNFDDIEEVIAPGEQAAADMAPALSRLSVPAGEYAAWLSRLRAAPFSAPVIDYVRVDSDGRLSPRVLGARLHTEPGKPLDPATVADDVNRLYGLNAYETVSYRLVEDGGRRGIVFDTRQKSWGPNFLKFGVSLEDDFEGSTAFNLAARLTSTGVNALGAEWRNDLQIGTEPEFATEFYQPLSFDSRYFVAPHLGLGQRSLNLFEDSRRIARYRISEVEAGIDIGRELGRWGEFRLGIFRGSGGGHLQTGDPQLTGFDFQSGGTFARFGIDTRDDAQIPKKGLRASLQWTGNRSGLGADTRYDTVEASLDQAWSWGFERRNTLQLGIEYATTLNTDSEVQHYFPLGGFLRLSGLEHGELSGPHAGLARLLYYREINRSGGLFDLPLYVGGSVEGGNVWQRKSDIGTGSLLLNGSVFAGLDTWFGLLFLGAGFSEDGDSGYYLFLGNPRR